METKTIVLTGASRGMGLALAKEFCSLGHTVYGCARSPGETEELKQQYPDHFHFSSVDHTRMEEVVSWAESIKEPITHLINNASIVNTRLPVWQLDEKEIHQVLHVNLLGVFNMLKTFIPKLIDQGDGLIFNIGSGWGKVGAEGLSPYCATKFGVEGIMQAVALELPKPLAIANLSPKGGVQTDMLKSAAPDLYANAPTAEEWAKAATAKIIGSDSTVNGESLSV